ncbi:hypothetical protein OROHE_020025 [Orobanche hederae]
MRKIVDDSNIPAENDFNGNIPSSVSPCKPILEESDGASRFSIMKKNTLHGSVIDFRGQQKVHSLLKYSRLDSLACVKLPVYNTLMGEFYCDIYEYVNLDGLAYFITSVRGRPLLVDDVLIREIMNITKDKKTEIFDAEKIVFNKKDFHAFLKVLCGCKILPLSVFDTEFGISGDYFCADAQFLALIYRANIMPKIHVV